VCPVSSEGQQHPGLYEQEQVIPPLCSALIRPHVDITPIFEASAEDRDQYIGMSSVKGPQGCSGLEHLSFRKRLQDQCLYSPEMSKLCGGPKLLEGESYHKNGARLFAEVHGGTVTGNRHKLKQERF